MIIRVLCVISVVVFPNLHAAPYLLYRNCTYAYLYTAKSACYIMRGIEHAFVLSASTTYMEPLAEVISARKRKPQS